MKTSTLTRIIVGAVGMALFLPVLIFSDTFVFPVAVALLSFAGIFELVKCTKLLNCRTVLIGSLVYAAAAPVVSRWCGGISAAAIITVSYVVFAIMYTVITQQTEIMNRIYSTVFLIAYVVFAFSSLVIIRDGQSGSVLMYLVFIIAWLTDTFAYFCGLAFGRHKLIPKLSPKKTVEGAIGGTLATLIVTLIIIVGVGLFSSYAPNYLPLIFLVIFTSLCGQAGDLALSQVKRYYKIKDFGNILPGHGGVLDRFDSVFAVASVIFVFTAAFPKVALF